jgi:hypothetical protein
MPTEIEERCNTVEECYEFMLAYAAQGLRGDVKCFRPHNTFMRRSLDALTN